MQHFDGSMSGSGTLDENPSTCTRRARERVGGSKGRKPESEREVSDVKAPSVLQGCSVLEGCCFLCARYSYPRPAREGGDGSRGRKPEREREVSDVKAPSELATIIAPSSPDEECVCVSSRERVSELERERVSELERERVSELERESGSERKREREGEREHHRALIACHEKHSPP